MDPYQHTIGRALLEMRDINDGQSADWRDKSRYQYVTANGIVFERRLPPGQTPRKKPLCILPREQQQNEEAQAFARHLYAYATIEMGRPADELITWRGPIPQRAEWDREARRYWEMVDTIDD